MKTEKKAGTAETTNVHLTSLVLGEVGVCTMVPEGGGMFTMALEGEDLLRVRLDHAEEDLWRTPMDLVGGGLRRTTMDHPEGGLQKTNL